MAAPSITRLSQAAGVPGSSCKNSTFNHSRWRTKAKEAEKHPTTSTNMIELRFVSGKPLDVAFHSFWTTNHMWACAYFHPKYIKHRYQRTQTLLEVEKYWLISIILNHTFFCSWLVEFYSSSDILRGAGCSSSVSRAEFNHYVQHVQLNGDKQTYAVPKVVD